MREDENDSTELAVVDEPQQEQAQSRSLADLREHAMATSPAVMQRALAEYSQRRTTFREWLRSQLKEGLHFGYPPGCEPKVDDRGYIGVWSKNGTVWYPPEQWQPKPSFYLCGADFVVDLMGLRPVYSPDLEGWQMAGSVAGIFVYKCELLSKANGTLVGEGRGSSKVAQRRDENGAVKMAMKSAKVSAVLNAYGLSDLFTQDMEDGPDKPVHDAPAKKTDAPKAQPRGKRVSPKELGDVCVRYRTWITNDTLVAPTPEALAEFASKVTGVSFAYDTVLKSDNWTQETLKKFSDEVAKHEPPPMEPN